VASVFTDAKIGVFTHPHDETLLQNRCFLYHLIGNKTGEWKVPVGGMGTVASKLEEAARGSGAEMVTDVKILRVDVDGTTRAVEFEAGGKRQTIEARFLLVNFGRNVLATYVNDGYEPAATDEGSVFKINMLLRRLPRLKSAQHDSVDAFRGTFHSDEGYEQMKASYQAASSGNLPEKLPCEVYCHTLTDDSILSPELRAQGFHTMTLFGLDTPYRLFTKDNETMRQRAERGFIDSLNRSLAEPLEDCLAVLAMGVSVSKARARRHRRSARALPGQHLPGRADLSVRRARRTSRQLGRRDEIRERFFSCGSAHIAAARSVESGA
jgi:phytoene dehydrogenase-like protein